MGVGVTHWRPRLVGVGARRGGLPQSGRDICRCEVVRLGVGKASQVCAYPLRPRLPDVQLGADRAYRGHAPSRNVTRERSRSLRVQRIGVRGAIRCPESGHRACRYLNGVDDHHEQLVRADQCDRRPGATAAPIRPWPRSCARSPPASPRCPGRAAISTTREPVPSGALSRASALNSRRSTRPP